jgi:His/Glu/Gln/Arg/opine family amino acid ABC transporter permease subunit
MTFDVQVIVDHLSWIFHGLQITLLINLIAVPMAFLLGIVVCMALMSRFKLIRLIATAYVEVMRNVPLLIQVFLVFYVLPFYGIRIGPLQAGIGCLAVYGAAYFAEIIRGAILSVPRGQVEAARALGLRSGKIMVKIILPQMLGYLIPPVTNIGISLLKESSVLSMITVTELTYYSNYIIGKTYAPVEILCAIALLYWIILAVFSIGMKVLEKRVVFTAKLGRMGI